MHGDVTVDDVRTLILSECADVLGAVGMDTPDVSDDLDLRNAGAIDSLGFVELIAALEDELGVELDFEAMDPEQLTVLGPLARHVADQVARARPGAA
jgi:acyl carrier protein